MKLLVRSAAALWASAPLRLALGMRHVSKTGLALSEGLMWPRYTRLDSLDSDTDEAGADDDTDETGADEDADQMYKVQTDGMAKYDSHGWEHHFDHYMADLQVTQDPEGLLEQCSPYIREPERGASRGLQILLHGFTACPGQFYLLAPRLLEGGWTVMVPLMPGHGRKPTAHLWRNQKGYDVDYYDQEMPASGAGYESYTAEIRRIAEKYRAAHPDSEIVLTGLSLGGTIALNLLMDAPAVWDRVMFMNPFMGIFNTGPIARSMFSNMVVVAGRFNFGRPCDLKFWPGNDGGTGSVCGGRYKFLRAVLHFTYKVRDEFWTRGNGIGIYAGNFLDRVGQWGRQVLKDDNINGALGLEIAEVESARCCCREAASPGAASELECALLRADQLEESVNPLKRGKLVCPYGNGSFWRRHLDEGYRKWSRFPSTNGSEPQVCVEGRQRLIAEWKRNVTQNMPTRVKVQMLATENDPGISNELIGEIVQGLAAQLRPVDRFGSCAWPEEFNHVYIAPKDYTFEGRDSWWLNASRVDGGRTALDHMVGFASDGRYVPVNGTKSVADHALPGMSVCEIEPSGEGARPDDATRQA